MAAVRPRGRKAPPPGQGHAAPRARGPASRRASSTPLLDASEILLARVLAFDAPTDQVLGEILRGDRTWGSRDRALLGDVVFGVVRQWARFKALAKQAPEGLAAWPLNRRLAVLAWPAAERGRLGLDEGSLAWLAQVDAGDPALESGLSRDVRANMPAWFLDRLTEEMGASAADALVQAFQGTAPLDLRVNTLKNKRDEALAKLLAHGVSAEPSQRSPWGIRVQGKPALGGLDLMREGGIEVQDEGSQLLALLLEARRGDMVADYCAGGGGKTLAIGAAMRDSGRLYAMDTSAARLAALLPRAKRAGLTNVYTMALEGEDDARLARLAGKLDRVIVDAPCSGLGTLRRSPDLKWRMSAAEVLAMSRQQKAILASASRLVKPGGRLVYATCSVLRAENEGVVSAFAGKNPSFLRLDAAAVLRSAKVKDPESLVQDGFLRLWPHIHETDGFFAAVFTRQV